MQRSHRYRLFGLWAALLLCRCTPQPEPVLHLHRFTLNTLDSVEDSLYWQRQKERRFLQLDCNCNAPPDSNWAEIEALFDNLYAPYRSYLVRDSLRFRRRPMIWVPE